MNNTHNHENTGPLHRPSTLTALRALHQTTRTATFEDALRLAERQADAFLDWTGHADSSRPVPAAIIAGLPRVKVVHETIAESGMSHWIDGLWLIVINAADHPTRQRFTLAHEFKHILDHTDSARLYTGRPWLEGAARADDAAKQRERAADHFAGCLLMPKSRMLRLWASGVRRPEDFAAHFDVSPAAAKVRLEQAGLTRPRWMCTRGLRTPESEAPAFDTTVQDAVEKMRALGLRPGRRAVRRTHFAGRPA